MHPQVPLNPTLSIIGPNPITNPNRPRPVTSQRGLLLQLSLSLNGFWAQITRNPNPSTLILACPITLIVILFFMLHYPLALQALAAVPPTYTHPIAELTSSTHYPTTA